MNCYVRVYLRRLGESATVASEIFAAKLVCAGCAPVADYLLCDIVSRQIVCRLSNYPRWTEPGLTLFARLLGEQPNGLLSQPAEGELIAVLQVGARPDVVLDVEVLRILCNGSSIAVTLLSPTALTSGLVFAAHAGEAIHSLIRRSVAQAAGWGDLLACPPAPLSQIKIRQRTDGTQFILAQDVPAPARLYLRQKLGVPFQKQTIDGSTWHRFLRALDVDTESTQRLPTP